MATVQMPEYPDNSQTTRAIEEKRHDIKVVEDTVEAPRKVIKGKAVKKKKGLGKKFSETFLSEDRGTVGEYLIFDVLIPAAKDTLTDLVGKGLEMMLYGDARSSPSRSRASGRGGYRSYSKYSETPRKKPQISTRDRRQLYFDDVLLETRGDAERALDYLLDRIDAYDVATVADFYDAVEVTSDYTDSKYGWYDLGDAYVKRVRDGYTIVLPRAEYLDR